MKSKMIFVAFLAISITACLEKKNDSTDLNAQPSDSGSSAVIDSSKVQSGQSNIGSTPQEQSTAMSSKTKETWPVKVCRVVSARQRANQILDLSSGTPKYYNAENTEWTNLIDNFSATYLTIDTHRNSFVLTASGYSDETNSDRWIYNGRCSSDEFGRDNFNFFETEVERRLTVLKNTLDEYEVTYSDRRNIDPVFARKHGKGIDSSRFSYNYNTGFGTLTCEEWQGGYTPQTSYLHEYAVTNCEDVELPVNPKKYSALGRKYWIHDNKPFNVKFPANVQGVDFKTFIESNDAYLSCNTTGGPHGMEQENNKPVFECYGRGRFKYETASGDEVTQAERHFYYVLDFDQSYRTTEMIRYIEALSKDELIQKINGN